MQISWLKNIKQLYPIFTITTVGILVVGLLAVLSVNMIPLPQATALPGSSSGPSPQGSLPS